MLLYGLGRSCCFRCFIVRTDPVLSVTPDQSHGLCFFGAFTGLHYSGFFLSIKVNSHCGNFGTSGV